MSTKSSTVNLKKDAIGSDTVQFAPALPIGGSEDPKDLSLLRGRCSIPLGSLLEQYHTILWRSSCQHPMCVHDSTRCVGQGDG